MEHAAERELIETAQRELLVRETSLQRPTIAELLRRTGLQRWKLTHRHRDLNDQFLVEVAKKWGHKSPDGHPLQKKLATEQARSRRLAGQVRDLTRELRRYAEVIEELRIQAVEAERERLQNIRRIDQARPLHPRLPFESK